MQKKKFIPHGTSILAGNLEVNRVFSRFKSFPIGTQTSCTRHWPDLSCEEMDSRLMSQNTLVEPAPETKSKLRIFTLYADFPAGIRAKHLARQIAPLAGEDFPITTEMWKLDSVTPIGPIRNMIAQEAGESDILLISTSSVDQPDPKFVQWLSSLVNWKANRLVSGLLIGLLGDREHWVSEKNAMVDQLAGFAQQTKMDFVWRSPANDSGDGAHWITHDLARLLDRKKSLHRPLPVI